MKNLIPLSIFSIAFGYLEAVVVVYIRRILPEDGWKLVHNISGLVQFLQQEKILFIEQTREASTIVILAMVAILSGQKLKDRFAYFLWIFGVWDIFYYIFLKLWLNWPESLFTIDILFLIPFPWIAPVILPLICSLGMMGIAIYLLK
ncbi:hypothetical protein KJ640_06535 [bacterium]|nr:hypothetical protein [bacterium]